ncbi:MAG TPA: FAD-dependent oxidoreductase, partial [Bacteroidota bacterium]|nr:FAD-dependent oxidoreductase [Bacteroidota bacterium]
MKRLVILGAGTAGTMIVNRFSAILDKGEWKITIVDQDETHYYQPGFLFIPFGIYARRDVVKPRRDFFPAGVEVLSCAIDRIDPEKNLVLLADKTALPYDYLIVATGARICPEQTEGLKGALWHKQIFDFYTIEGACALADFFR